MASLNKLAIRGIRSFDDKQVSIIEFFSPVTVIVGHNGSGKTTIIECLKYATTGDQPPNSRGGAFVHDPKMANEKEVKAQVKLRFFAANGQRMLAVRNLSVTTKKTAGLTMKTLESILAVDDPRVEKNSKRAVISTKCAEMDTEIPQLLGVSKAVLENVIFCHQEDSYWPLAEPSALKKKFDDIFEATRYTKALENIKTLRKDRVADLKAEKERLESLAKEKGHADKLRARMSELKNTIHAKEITYEETKKEYDEVVVANNKYHDHATRFREIYIKIENLQERQQTLQADLDETRMNVPEIVGSDEELQRRVERFDENVQEHKRQRQKAAAQKQDVEGDLDTSRMNQEAILKRVITLNSEANQQQQRLKDREQFIRDIATKFEIENFGPNPLDGSQVIDFMSKLDDYKEKQNNHLENLQVERKSIQEGYNAKSRELTASVEKLKADRSSLRHQITERNGYITKGERELENTQELPGQLKITTGDIEEKTRRLDKLKTDFKNADYEEKLSQNAEKKTVAESKRERLNQEFIMLNREAESRANLNLKRKDIKSKNAEIESTVDAANTKLVKLVGKAASIDTIESDIEKIAKKKMNALEIAEIDAKTASGDHRQAEASVSEKSATLKSKQKDLRDAERQMKSAFDRTDMTLDAAIKDAFTQLNFAKEEVISGAGAATVYERLLTVGKQKKTCTACNRHMDDDELHVFEKYLKEEIKRAKQTKDAEAGVEAWEEEHERLQRLRPIQSRLDTLKFKEIPTVEDQVAKAEAAAREAKEAADKAAEKVNALKEELKDIQAVREYGKTIARLQAEVERLIQEIESIENELASSGSTKSTEDVQNEIEALSNGIRVLDKESNALMRERDRQMAAQRSIESELHRLELESAKIRGKMKEKENLEGQIEQWKKDIANMSDRMKITDQHIAEAQSPIDALDAEYKTQQRELDSKLSTASVLVQDLNRRADKLADTQKQVEKYVQLRREQGLRELNASLEEAKEETKELDKKLEEAREKISKIDKEISESGSSLSNLRENIRLRKLVKQIQEAQAEIDSYDMEEAAKAKRTFEAKWKIAKDKEEDLKQKFSHIGGEISSHRSQLKTWEADAKEYKDVNKHYTDQLIKVKMSDMANNDLEKYGKALEKHVLHPPIDTAIMKYHTLKMEEVNDTMRHLWNKTYQGTDIDGIKIRSDVEGGASKRSYNYRVVMTKDQVEMDMRGRCSAGQKMLASIIIRLALSDSFGQNCGILALDEPTNALDTENIEALASSLVDIINERKNHANFQLIIITHDENFLRKLGQSDVMEYYWRVSRDARQKSTTERQRIR
ncbi:P-loop containing nucleoside triphosphate hydrolase protein [Lentinula boryana]|uniref:P-loop containing nucleoside triphosphate hydrolase protein n=1 Tax=Lentinula boryana TaxID=40481 RepID=A0ABQ8QAZ8_9AGAR|nr:P-loop containing nucleoside triphosphate hydrolase protein [Lentinula boryana]